MVWDKGGIWEGNIKKGTLERGVVERRKGWIDTWFETESKFYSSKMENHDGRGEGLVKT